jgi:hypothetical protein
MTQDFYLANFKPDRVMQPEHFEQIVAAIIEGKYSWACVLILRFAGYNPLHYFPYRTYKRLIKNNGKNLSSTGIKKHNRDKDTEFSVVKSFCSSEKVHSRQINDRF